MSSAPAALRPGPPSKVPPSPPRARMQGVYFWPIVRIARVARLRSTVPGQAGQGLIVCVASFVWLLYSWRSRPTRFRSRPIPSAAESQFNDLTSHESEFGT